VREKLGGLKKQESASTHGSTISKVTEIQGPITPELYMAT
jgi:hypothetical protein